MRSMKVSALAALLFLTGITGLRSQQVSPAPRQMTALEIAQDSTVFLEVSYATKKEVVKRLRKIKKFRTIETALGWWIEHEPVNDTARIILAEIYESQNYFQEACDIYEKLIYLSPENTDYMSRAITLFTKQRYYTIAIKYCDRFLKLKPGIIPIMEKKADLLDREKKYFRAAEAYGDIVKEAPHRDDMKLKWAAALSKDKNYDKANKVYDGLLQAAPDNTDYKRGAAIALFHAGRLQEAEKHIKDVLMFDSRDYDLIEVYCNLLTAQQRYSDAINYYYRLLQGDPLDVKVKWRIAQIYAWKGEYYVALSLYEQILRTVNVPPEILRERARVLGWAHKHQESLEAYGHIIANNPGDSLVRIEADAKRSLYNRRYATSMQHHKRLISMEEKNWDARIQLAQLYSDFSRWPEGRRLYQDIITDMPSFKRVRKAMNKLDLYAGRPRATWEAEYGHAHSLDRYERRLTDYECYTSTALAALPPYGDASLAAGYRFTRYHFEESADQSVNRVLLRAAYNQQPNFWLNGAYSFAAMPDETDDLQEYDITAGIRLADIHRLSITTTSAAYIRNAITLSNGLQRRERAILYRALINRYLTFNAKYAGYGFTDSQANTQNELDLKLTFSTFFQHTGFSLHAGVNRLLSRVVTDDTQSATDYFAPDEFTTLNAGISWREYIKGYDYAWGEEKIYYDLGYRITVEPQLRYGHRVHGRLNIDIAPRATISLSGEMGRVDSRTLTRQALLTTRIFM